MRCHSERSKESGFTTVELMVVLVITVVLSSLVIISMGPALNDARLRSGCRMVVSTVNYARSFAVTHQTYTRVIFDRNSPGVAVQAQARDRNGEERMRPVTTPSGRYRKLPRGLRIVSIRKPGSSVDEDFAGFSQLGQSDGAAITIEDRNGKARTIAVDAVTGRATVRSSLTRTENSFGLR